MNEMDHYVKGDLKIRDYIRYCDDFLLFHNDKSVLRRCASMVESFAAERLCLRLSRCDLFPVSHGVDFLGYRHFRGYMLLRKSTSKRVARRLARLPDMLEQGKISAETFRSVVASAGGWLRWANTHNFQRKVHFSELVEMANAACKREREAVALL